MACNVIKKYFLVLFILGASALSSFTHAQTGNIPSHNKDKDVENALNALSQNDLKKAYGTLESVDSDTLAYRMAYLEMQKIHYRLQDWDRFFGFAQFYRKKLLPQFFQPELISLEALALTKHCQYDASIRVIEFAKELTSILKNGKPKNNTILSKLYEKEITRGGGDKQELSRKISALEAHIKSIQNLLTLQDKLPGHVKANAVASKIRLFSKDMFWSVESKDAKSQVIQNAVKNPRSMRVYVKNLCKETL